MHLRSVGSTGLIASISLLFGLPISAARLDVVASSTSIAPGDALSITVLGDSEGETAGLMFARLHYSGPVIANDAEGPFVLESSPSDDQWNVFGSQHGVCGRPEDPPMTCIAVSAFTDFGALDLLPSTLSVFAFDTSGAAPGSTLTFQVIPEFSGFFGAGPSDVVTVQVIPEPTPASLVAIGLLALAAARRVAARATTWGRRCQC